MPEIGEGGTAAAGKGVGNKMKAHVRKSAPQPKETALLFCFEPEKRETVCRVLESFGAKAVVAGPEDASQTLGALLGMEGFPRYEDGGAAEKPEASPEGDGNEVIVFSGFERSRLDAVIARLKSEGASVPYKAVLTASNQGWTMAHLLGEISVEHDFFSKLNQMRQLTRQLLQSDPRRLSESDRAEAVKAVNSANAILKKPDASDLEKMELTIAALQRSIAMIMASEMVTGTAGSFEENPNIE